MAYFPFFVDIEGKRWLIAGGGEVSLRKVRDLLPCGAAIQVVSPHMADGLAEMEGSGEYGDRLILVKREFKESDLADVDFVIAATSDAGLNSAVSAMCGDRGIPVNVVDVREECSFIFPSIVREGPVVVGISTGGMSPVMARYLKEKVRSVLPEDLGPFTVQLGGYRKRIKDLFPDSPKTRSALFYELAKEGLENRCRLTEEQAEIIINRKLEQEHE